MLPRSLLLVLILIASSAALAQPRVVASILPIHSLTDAIMQGVAEPELLIPAQASPHDWSVRPSQRRSLERADLIIWAGESLEGFMPRLLQGLPESGRDLRLTALPGLELSQEDSHGHGHAEAGIDPHLWLDPRQAAIMARGIAQRLIEADPVHAETYRQNLQGLLKDIEHLDQELEQAMTGLKGIPFIVYHDAYGYFVQRYGLRQVGEVTKTAHQQPGARHLRALRARLVQDDVPCLFTEPQFQPAIVTNLIEGTSTRLAELDPIGSDLRPGPEAYFQLLRGIGASLTECLGARQPASASSAHPDP